MIKTAMQKRALQLLQVLGLMVSIGLTPSALAAMVTLTFEGTFSSYSDAANQLPFNIPAAGTKAVYTTTIDATNAAISLFAGRLTTATSLTLGANGPTYYAKVDNGHQDADGLSIIANDISSSIINISTLYGMPSYSIFESLGNYADFWLSPNHLTTDNSHLFGVFFASYADQQPVGPLTSLEFVAPVPEEWDQAYIFYLVDGETDSHVLFQIDSVSVSQVPVPAAAWLFGSALLGLVGLGRKTKREVVGR